MKSFIRYIVQKVSVLGIILVHIFPHSDWIRTVRMREGKDQNNSEYGHFLRSISNLKLVFKSNDHDYPKNFINLYIKRFSDKSLVQNKVSLTVWQCFVRATISVSLALCRYVFSRFDSTSETHIWEKYTIL